MAENFVRVYISADGGEIRDLTALEPGDQPVEWIGSINGQEIPVRFFRAEDGVSGQDRESYTDEQDRDSYSVDRLDGEPVESEPDKMWHVTITHKYGTLPSIHRTEAGAKRALAQYVAQEWENVMGATERPENDEEAVRMYFFETHESEWYDATEVTVAD